jgi:hypothetical protein
MTLIIDADIGLQPSHELVVVLLGSKFICGDDDIDFITLFKNTLSNVLTFLLTAIIRLNDEIW